MEIKVSVTGPPLGGRDARGRFLKTAALKRELLTNMAETLLEKVREGFEKESDPTGSKWAETQRGGRILQDTGRLRNSWKTKVSGSSFSVTSSAAYGSFHQSGTRHMKARKMVPDGDLPPDWARAVQATIDEIMADFLGA